MTRTLPLVLLLAACPEDSDVIVETPTGPVTGEVVDYLYGMDAWFRTATATVTVDVEVGGDCMAFDYSAPPPEACRFDGLEATCTLTDDVLTVCGPVGALNGATLVVEVDLTVPKETLGSTDLGYSTSRAGDVTDHYLLSWVGGCARFGPCDADPATFATYTFEVAHELGEVLLCPGTLSPGERLSSCTFDLDGGPTYSTFGYALSSDFERVELGNAGSVAVVWYDHGRDQSRDIDVADVASFVAFMSDLAGPYPYGDELRFFSWDSYWSGFEHPGNVAMNQGLRPNPTSFRDNPLLHTTLHEVAHMWAGNQTTLASERDFAWKEAAAEYLSFVWEDERGMGEPSVRYWKFVADLSTTFPAPEDPDLELLDFYGNAYGPGPMILFRQLEVMFGREAVLDGIGALLGQGPRAASIDDVTAALEQATGEDLGDYVSAWMRGTGEPVWPVIDATISGDELLVDQTTMTGSVWPCAFRVRITDDAGSFEVPVRYDLGGESTRVTVTLPRTPGVEATIEVDPHSEALVYGRQTDLVRPTTAELADMRPH